MDELFIPSRDKFPKEFSNILLILIHTSCLLRALTRTFDFLDLNIRLSTTQLTILSILWAKSCKTEIAHKIRSLCKIKKSNFIKTITPLVKEKLLLFDLESKKLRLRKVGITEKGILFMEKIEDQIVKKIRERADINLIMPFLSQLNYLIRF